MMKNIAFLISAILFIDLNAMTQKQHYDVYAIKFASAARLFPISDVADKGPSTDSVNLDFMVWLIKGDGKNILVDAGFLNDMEEAKDFNIKNYVRPDSILSKLHLKAGDITDIILSHPHWDHIDGIDLFPNAQAWMQKEDFNYFVSTAWQKDGNKGGFNKRDVRKMVELNLAGRLTLVDGDDKEIIPGIKVYTGSRHTFNSQYVLVETGVNKIVLASDNIWIYYILEHLTPPSAGGTLDPAGYVKAMQRMKSLVTNPKFIIPGHDSQVLERFPKVTEGVVKIE